MGKLNEIAGDIFALADELEREIDKKKDEEAEFLRGSKEMLNKAFLAGEITDPCPIITELSKEITKRQMRLEICGYEVE